MVARIALLLLVVAGNGTGCGSRQLHPPLSDGGPGEPAADTGALARDLLSPSADLRPPACGGVARASGTARGQSFQAGYVYVNFVGGDCAGHLDVTIAASDRNEGLALMLSLRPSADSRTFVGHAIQEARIGSAGEALQADVEVTAAPDPMELERGVMDGTVTGTFTIDAADVSLTGTFSSPVCRGVFCV